MQCAACQAEVHPVKEMFGPGHFVSKCPRAECGAPMADAPMVTAHPNLNDELANLRNEEAMLSGIATPSDEHLRQLGWVRQQIARLTAPAKPALALAYEFSSQPVPEVMRHVETLSAVRPSAAQAPQVSQSEPVDFLDQVRARLVAIDAQVAGLEKLKAEGRKLRAMLDAAEAAEAN